MRDERGLVRAARTRAVLGFELTPSQGAVVDTLLADMAGAFPSHTLLQGDVGCGKTAVSFLAMLCAVGSGFQAAIMVPTRILAQQHLEKLQGLIRRLPPELQPRCALLVSGDPNWDPTEVRTAAEAGAVDIVVGTHALSGHATSFKGLGLVVIDEQQKFGVNQRALFANKTSAHTLTMSATPIPRTLALIMYGDLKHLTIAEMPPGRLPVITSVITSQRQKFDLMREELSRGGRIFYVCPKIGSPSRLGRKRRATAAATRDTVRVKEELCRLQGPDALGPAASLGELHGDMQKAAQDEAYARFREGATDVLVCTSIIEVGVDVPEATMIVIEAARQFGMSDLHQLRGRVGRGTQQGRCLLMAAPGQREALARLRYLERHASGFDVAEHDYELRGPGAFLGTKQSGRDEEERLRYTRLPRDRGLLARARADAEGLTEAYGEDVEDWPLALQAGLRRHALLDLAELPTGSLGAGAEL